MAPALRNLPILASLSAGPFWACILLSFGSAFATPIGFEKQESFVADTAISAYPGWEKSGTGVAKISEQQAQSGTQVLEILPGFPDGAATVSFVPAKDGIVFLDFWIRPVADASAAPVSTVDANGAVLGFLEQGGEGTVVAVRKSKDPNSESNSIETKFRFPLDEANAAADWIRVTIRQNLRLGSWDLYLGGKLTLIDQPIIGNVTTENGAFSMYSASSESAFLDDFSTVAANPLFPDADKDGVPDAVEKSHGMNPLADDRKVLQGGVSNIARFLWESSPLSRGPSSYAIVYVDNKSGDDRNSGLLPYKTGNDGPRASLSEVLREAGKNTTIILGAGTGVYDWPNEVKNPYLETINIIINGDIVAE